MASYRAVPVLQTSPLQQMQVVVNIAMNTVKIFVDFRFVNLYVHTYINDYLVQSHSLLQEAIAVLVDEELSQILHESSFFSLMIDESTDVSTTQTLVVYIRFVYRGTLLLNFF